MMTTCKNGHPQTTEDTYTHPHTGRRSCLACRRTAEGATAVTGRPRLPVPAVIVTDGSITINRHLRRLVTTGTRLLPIPTAGGVRLEPHANGWRVTVAGQLFPNRATMEVLPRGRFLATVFRDGTIDAAGGPLGSNVV